MFWNASQVFTVRKHVSLPISHFHTSDPQLAFTGCHSHRRYFVQPFGMGWVGRMGYLEGGGIDRVEHAEAVVRVRLVVAVDLHGCIKSKFMLLSFHIGGDALATTFLKTSLESDDDDV